MYVMNQLGHIHHRFQDKEQESTEQIRIGLRFLISFLAEVWARRGSSCEN